MSERVREIIAEQAQLPVDVGAIGDDANLFDAGMTSHAAVNVMVALEDEFEVEFPDSLLNREVFSSVAAIVSALEQIGARA